MEDVLDTHTHIYIYTYISMQMHLFQRLPEVAEKSTKPSYKTLNFIHSKRCSGFGNIPAGQRLNADKTVSGWKGECEQPHNRGSKGFVK